ncbi:MAG: hypothetical protein K2G77_06160 [Muribaculaceae bacterium]|nr:hypothetical protein [Muribaculaceae bacterium]
MKIKIKIFLTTILICLLSFSSIAQTSRSNNDVKRRAAERVALLQDYIAFMADKKNDKETREYYKKKALPLFVGRGYEYEENGITKDGVKMQTTSINTNTTKSSLMREYFQRLINLRYSDVKITSSDIVDMKVSDLKKIGNNRYVCTVQYVQKFYGFRDGELVYGPDITTKRIICYIEAEEIEGGKTEYIMQLGDVEAVQTESN